MNETIDLLDPTDDLRCMCGEPECPRCAYWDELGIGEERPEFEEPDEDYVVLSCETCGREIVGEYAECPYCRTNWTPERGRSAP